MAIYGQALVDSEVSLKRRRSGSSRVNKFTLCPLFVFVLVKKRTKQLWTQVFDRSVKADKLVKSQISGWLSKKLHMRGVR